MSQQRYTPEFKDEAVRQVTENALWFQSVAAATPALQNVMRRSGATSSTTEAMKRRRAAREPVPGLL
jgi:transposase-like protein